MLIMSHQESLSGSFPALCSHPGIPPHEQASLRSTWLDEPRGPRQQVPLPQPAWTEALGEPNLSYFKLVGGDRTYIPFWVGLPDDSSSDLPGQFEAATHEGVLHVSLEFADDAPVPKLGDRVIVSKAGEMERNVWGILVAGYLNALECGLTHTQPILEENGLTFTKGFINEMEYWITGTVRDCNAHGNTAAVEVVVDSIIWNQPPNPTLPDTV